MKVKSWVCSPGGSIKDNADKISIEDNTILVFDGAAPLNPIPFGDFSNSTTWFVNEFEALFWAELVPSITTIEAIENTRLKAFERFNSEKRRLDAGDDEDPISCLLLIKDFDEHLEFVNIGDCCALIKSGSRIMRFGNNAVKQMDTALNSLLPADCEAKKKALFSQVSSNRKQRNRVFGYDVLTPNDSVFGRCERIIVDKSPDLEVLCMSDGFYRAVDTLDIYDDETLLNAVSDRGVNSVLEEVRYAEANDQACEKFPRVKIHDDATAAYLIFSE